MITAIEHVTVAGELEIQREIDTRKPRGLRLAAMTEADEPGAIRLEFWPEDAEATPGASQ